MLKIIIFALLIFVNNAYAVDKKPDAKPEEVSLSANISESIFQIKQAATEYYLKSGFWPTNIDELKVGGFLPIDFAEKTEWGKKWKIELLGEDLNISIDVPDAEELGDVAADSEVLDVASRALKAIDGTKKRFAEGDKSAQQTAAEDKNKGQQAFERGNIENRAIIKELTITDDEQYLNAAKQNIVLQRLPNNYIRISSTLKSGVQISTDNRDVNFNTKVNFNDGISAKIFIDKDDIKFYLDPSKESILKKLTLSKIIDIDDDEFFLDPSEESALKELRVKLIEVDQLFIDKINGGTPITVESLDQVAITRIQAADNILVSNGRGDDRTVGFVTISVVDNPKFVSVKTKENVDVGGNLTVGLNSDERENIANAAFELDGNDAFVAGDLGVNGNIYSAGSLIINSANNQLTLNGDFIQSSGNFSFRANNNTTQGLEFSSNSDGLSLTTTGNSPLNIGSSGDQITFQTSTNGVDGISFKNSSNSNILTIDTENKRVGINTTTPKSALQVVGQLRATKVLIAARADETPITITRPDAGQWLDFNYGTGDNNSFGVYNFASNPSTDIQKAANIASITANKGSIAMGKC
ncbi:MAG: hypothetical protein HAW58_05580, partial [Candidatus Thioglobus sp.]|nr:hypothetical protein [Candidatus Thioglobus sp.]